jgi:hypothetical protein
VRRSGTVTVLNVAVCIETKCVVLGAWLPVHIQCVSLVSLRR